MTNPDSIWRRPKNSPPPHHDGPYADQAIAALERKVLDMKKRKVKLREKIRSKPKARTNPKKKKKVVAGKSITDGFNSPTAETVDQGLEVMSHVILDFAGPLLETCDDEDSEKKAISLAIYVWNAALLPDQECWQSLEAYLAQCQKAMPPEELKTLSDYVDRLVQTKRVRFADNHKKITNCTFGDFGADRHIEVGYTME
ncbi:MAG: hypothetical protein WAU91_07875 [Desulfatitalea sp.]